jgi:hypothetical protein
MIRWSALAILPLIVACADRRSEPDVRWKSSYTPAECKLLTSYESIVARCGGGDPDRARELMATDQTLCLPFSTPRRMEGIFVHGFELSNFYAGARDLSQVAERNVDHRDTATWFSWTGRATEKILTLPQFEDGQAFRIDIVGKQSLCEGHYGHIGGASHEVIATEFLRITPLGNIYSH